jgi:hypothetical protein
MPAYVLIVDLFAIMFAAIGFTMAFRQGFVRKLFGQNERPAGEHRPADPDQDPLTYVLRIAGMMILVFGLALGIMVTVFHMV